MELAVHAAVDHDVLVAEHGGYGIGILGFVGLGILVLEVDEVGEGRSFPVDAELVGQQALVLEAEDRIPSSGREEANALIVEVLLSHKEVVLALLGFELQLDGAPCGFGCRLLLSQPHIVLWLVEGFIQVLVPFQLGLEDADESGAEPRVA